MQFITHTVLFQALGYAIANSLWQMAFLWFAYLIFSSLLKLDAAYKCRLGMGLQITGFVWFVITLLFYYQQCSDALSNVYSLPIGKEYQLILPTLENGATNSLVAVLIRAEQLLPFLSFAYLIVLAVLVFQWIKSYSYAQQIKHNGLHKINVEWRVFTKEIAKRLGIKQNVSIYLSELINTPMTIGFLKPIILVPLASLNHLSTAQMEAVLLHELAHIKRFDYLLNIVVSAMEMVLFFNPFTQLLGKQIKKERENSCDDWVLQFQYSPTIYAEALLQIATMQSNASFAMTLTRGNDKELLHRVKRVVGHQEKKFNYRYQLLTLFLLSILFGCIAWIQPIKQSQSLSKNAANTKSSTEQLIVEPMAAKVSNPLFNPMFFLQEPIKKEICKAAELANNIVEEDPGFTEQVLRKVATIVPVATKKMESIDWQQTKKDIALGLEVANTEINNLYKNQIASDSLNQLKVGVLKSEDLKSQKNWFEGLAQLKDVNLSSVFNQERASDWNKQVKKWEEDIQKVFEQLSIISSTAGTKDKLTANKIKETSLQYLQKLNNAQAKQLQAKNKFKLDSLKQALAVYERNYAAYSQQYKTGYPYAVCQPASTLNYTIDDNHSATSVQINTCTDTATTITGKAKRYEIIVKNKSGIEKRLTVIVED